MRRSPAYIFTVLVVSLAILLTSVLGGNALCIGEDGHVAIELAHHSTAFAAESTGAEQALCFETSDDHGPCVDMAVSVAMAARQTSLGTPELWSLMVPPVLFAPVPTIMVVSARPAPYPQTDPIPSTSPLDSLRCVVLVI